MQVIIIIYVCIITPCKFNVFPLCGCLDKGNAVYLYSRLI